MQSVERKGLKNTNIKYLFSKKRRKIENYFKKDLIDDCSSAS